MFYYIKSVSVIVPSNQGKEIFLFLAILVVLPTVPGTIIFQMRITKNADFAFFLIIIKTKNLEVYFCKMHRLCTD